MKQLLAVLLLSFIFIGYQNCGKQMDFAASSDKVGISEDAEVGPIDDIDILEDDGEDVTNEEEVLDPPNDLPGDDNGDDGDDDEVVDNPAEEGEEENGNSGHDKSKVGYICILEGSGKSQRLGYSDSQLIVNGSTPQTVCTTKRACLEIVSQKFNVVSAEYRGFCKNDKGHSVALSESELEALINK